MASMPETMSPREQPINWRTSMFKFIVGTLALVGIVALVSLPRAIDRLPDLARWFGHRSPIGESTALPVPSIEDFTDQVPGLETPNQQGEGTSVARSDEREKARPKKAVTPHPSPSRHGNAPSVESGEEKEDSASQAGIPSEPRSDDAALTDIQDALVLYESGNHK